MSDTPPSYQKRVLAIDPTSRGFGYVVLEGPENLVDWGVKEVREDKKVRCLKMIGGLIERYRPDVIIVEDATGKGSRRCQRVQEFIAGISELVSERRTTVRSFSRYQVKEAFAPFGARTKHQIAQEIAGRFPELGSRLPPSRKPWMSEDSRMAIFDAVSLALTFYGGHTKKASNGNHSYQDILCDIQKI